MNIVILKTVEKNTFLNQLKNLLNKSKFFQSKYSYPSSNKIIKISITNLKFEFKSFLSSTKPKI